MSTSQHPEPQQPEPPHASSHTSTAADRAPVVIRHSPIALIGCAFLLLGLLSLAMSVPAVFGWTVVIPVLLAVWLLRVRTTVTPDGVTARSEFATTRIPWTTLDGLRFPKRGRTRAVLTDGREIGLPAVTFGTLPLVAAASGGRITDPYAVADEAERAADPTTASDDGVTTPDDAHAAAHEDTAQAPAAHEGTATRGDHADRRPDSARIDDR